MAAKHDLKIDQGTDTSIKFVLKKNEIPLDLTGYKAAMQLRYAAYSEEAIDTLTTENGRLTIEPEEGKITAVFPHEVTEAFLPGYLVYDLEIETSTGEITRILQGKVQIIAEVTRVKAGTSS